MNIQTNILYCYTLLNVTHMICNVYCCTSTTLHMHTFHLDDYWEWTWVRGCVMSVYEWPFCLTVLAKFSVMLIFNYIWLIWVAITHNLWIMLMKFTYNSTQYNKHTHILLLSHLHPPTDSLSNAYMRNAHHISTIAISFFTRTFHIHTNTHVYTRITSHRFISTSICPECVYMCVWVCVFVNFKFTPD